MKELLDRQLVIIAGKGGVGKTTTSSGIALKAAKDGRKTLLVTVDPAKRLEDSLGVPVGSEPTAIQPNLEAMMLDPEAIITQHLEERVPEATITEHPLFRYVTNYLPGLNELMAIGKLNDVRREGKYDLVVVDTAPTGHALSFLSAPGAIKELMSEKSLLKWAIRGYTVWQKVSGAARSAGNIFKKKGERDELPPDIDFERIFGEIEEEAERIQEYLTDAERSGLVLVTLPEKLPVEETCDLHQIVTEELGMRVHTIVVNKMQPDALAGVQSEFDTIHDDPDRRTDFVLKAAQATKQRPALIEAMLDAAAFAEVRRKMNQAHVKTLTSRLPEVPYVEVPLFKKDVQGLRRLQEFQAALFPDD